MALDIRLPDDAEAAFKDMMTESGFDTPVQLFNELVRVYRYAMVGARRGDELKNVNPASGEQRIIPSKGLQHIRRQANTKLRLVAGKRPEELQELAS